MKPRPGCSTAGARRPMRGAGANVGIATSFGVAGAAHRNGGRYCPRYAWPSGRWGSLPLEGGIEAAYRADIDAAPDADVKMAEITERLNKLRSPFRSAEAFWIEEIVDPRETRPLLCEFAGLGGAAEAGGAVRASHAAVAARRGNRHVAIVITFAHGQRRSGCRIKGTEALAQGTRSPRAVSHLQSGSTGGWRCRKALGRGGTASPGRAQVR
jgi:hypothetical protein